MCPGAGLNTRELEKREIWGLLVSDRGREPRSSSLGIVKHVDALLCGFGFVSRTISPGGVAGMRECGNAGGGLP
jgi:hypothetical protein